MNSRILKIIAVIIIFTYFGVNNIEAQENKNLKTRLALFTPINMSMGQSVYTTAHRTAWLGIGLSAHMDISDKFLIGLEFSNASSPVRQKEVINSEKTKLSNTTFLAGYRCAQYHQLDIDIYGLVGGTLGINQGDFKGYHYGMGIKASKYFDKSLYLFLGTDFQNYGFNIQASPYWEPRFNRASMLRFSIGAGLYL